MELILDKIINILHRPVATPKGRSHKTIIK
jgi:hypothetical protein